MANLWVTLFGIYCNDVVNAAIKGGERTIAKSGGELSHILVMCDNRANCECY